MAAVFRARSPVALALFAVLCVIAGGLLFLPRDRAAFLDVETGLVTVTLVENLYGITLPAGRLEQAGAESIDIEDESPLGLKAGTVAEFKMSRLNGELILSLSYPNPGEAFWGLGEQDFAQNAELKFEKASWQNMLPIELEGNVEIGIAAGHKNPDYLYKGSYRFSEKPFFWRYLGGRSQEVRSGEFLSGTRIKIVDWHKRDVTASVLVEPAGPPLGLVGRTPAMQVLADSGYGWLHLEVTRDSPRDAVLLSPRWTDRALSKPWVLGLSTVLAFLLIILELFSIISRQFGRRSPHSDEL